MAIPVSSSAVRLIPTSSAGSNSDTIFLMGANGITMKDRGDFYYSSFDKCCGILHGSSRVSFTEYLAPMPPSYHQQIPFVRCVISRFERTSERMSLSSHYREKDLTAVR